MKYPIGIQEFDKIINEGYTYVDKTELIYKLAHEGSYYLLPYYAHTGSEGAPMYVRN